MKKYILIAGVNGAGKSTLYQTLHFMQGMKRVNTDEILREFGDWRNPADIIKAGKIAVKKIDEYFSSGESFNQETTLCGRSAINNVKKATDNGYNIELHFVGVASAEIAKERVRSRVEHGGHGIPDNLIEKRFTESFRNVKQILPLCHLAVFYDNTDGFRRFAIYRNGMPAVLSRHVPEWYRRYVDDL